jgi:hypothetical protein
MSTPPPNDSPIDPEPMPTTPKAITRHRTWSWPTFAVGVAAGMAVLGGTLGIVSVTGGQDEPAKPATFTLRGTFELNEGSTRIDSGCEGYRGYNDIAKGAGVTVYNAVGAVVAKGELGDSTYTGSVCAFKLFVVDVPDGEKFYQVEVTHRGKITVPAEDAKAGRVALTLGNH